MKGRGYLSISAITHFVLAALLFFFWPRFSQVKKFEILLQPMLPQTEADSRNESSEPIFHATKSFQGVNQSFFDVKPVPVPDVPLPKHNQENVPLDANKAYLPSLDDLAITEEMIIRTFTPNLEIPAESPLRSLSRSPTNAEIFWIEGEEYLAENFSKNVFSQLLLKSQLTIEVSIEVEESGIVSNTIKTLTGEPEIDQQVDRFLAQMIFRPSNRPYTVRFVVKLIPGTIYQ